MSITSISPVATGSQIAIAPSVSSDTASQLALANSKDAGTTSQNTKDVSYSVRDLGFSFFLDATGQLIARHSDGDRVTYTPAPVLVRQIQVATGNNDVSVLSLDV